MHAYLTLCTPGSEHDDFLGRTYVQTHNTRNSVKAACTLRGAKENAIGINLSILMDFNQPQNSDLNTSMERRFQELLIASFIFEIGLSKL